MKEILERVDRALALQEARVERIAGRARLAFFAVVGAIALLNAPMVTARTNVINFGAIGIALTYSLAVWLWLRGRGYRAVMKYSTTLIDLTLVHLTLLAYASADIPSVALKNPAFLFVYPILGMTVFRFDPKLTLVAGGYALFAYGILFTWVSRWTTVTWGNYAAELFGPDVTVVGQMTKVLVLALFVALITLLARYTRSLFHRLVWNELETRQQKDRIERELELASQVQAQLLPRAFPNLAGLSLHGTIMEGRSVGGDYYDLIPLSQSVALLIVADVAGKGVPAALIMSGVRAAAHLCASMGLGIEEVHERLNRLIYESTSPHNYVTAFLAEIDVSANGIRYINAGHPAPLVLCGQQIRRLQEGSAPLGLFPSLPGSQSHFEQLSPGSVLVACTDGVSEHANNAGEEFGDTELHRFLAEHGTLDSTPFADRLLDELRRFGDNRPFEDDATLVVAKFTGQAA
jgi:hypothetical protein